MKYTIGITGNGKILVAITMTTALECLNILLDNINTTGAEHFQYLKQFKLIHEKHNYEQMFANKTYMHYCSMRLLIFQKAAWKLKILEAV